MIARGILNPALNELLCRIRHTNTLVIADRGFPFWPQIETVDISLVDDIPTVLDVFNAIRANFVIGQVVMADEFLQHNDLDTKTRFRDAFDGIKVIHEPHLEFKKRVPQAIGLIRTAGTAPYSNLILESA